MALKREKGELPALGGKPLSLVPKYLSKAQLDDPRSRRTADDFRDEDEAAAAEEQAPKTPEASALGLDLFGGG